MPRSPTAYWTYLQTLAWVRWRQPGVERYFEGDNGPALWSACVIYPTMALSAPRLPNVTYEVVCSNPQMQLDQAVREGWISAKAVNGLEVRAIEPAVWRGLTLNKRSMAFQRGGMVAQEVRLRGRIERVLDAARAQGHRTGENPARWRGHLDHLLPKRQKLTRGHHAAMPYDQVHAFVKALRQRDAVSAYGLEFLILTAARSGEVMGATWAEIDLKEKIWTVPGIRMKAGREHRVPLGARAIEILEAVAPLARNPKGAIDPKRPVFPGKRKEAPLSVMSFEMLLRRMKLEVTTHGFRSSFRDWSGEVSSFPREIAEAALAHTVGDQTERAYRRGDALEKRRELMEAWATYVNTAPAKAKPPASGEAAAPAA